MMKGPNKYNFKLNKKKKKNSKRAKVPSFLKGELGCVQPFSYWIF